MAVVGVGVASVGVGCGGATPPEERISDDRSGTGRAHRSIGIRAGSGRRNFGMPRCPRAPHPGEWHPLRPQRYHGANGPGRIEPPAVLTPIFLDAPGQFGDSAAADERIGVKNPSRARLRGKEDVRTRIPSAPAPLRHRDPAPEAPSSRFSAARAALPYPTIPPTGLGGVRSSEWRPISLSPSRKTSDLPPGIGISIGPPILISTKQQFSKTTQQHDCTTTQQHNTTGKQKTMTSVSTEVSQSVLKSVSTDVNQSVGLFE